MRLPSGIFLASLGQAEDRVINALLDYYQVKEILLPPRKPGEPLPRHLINFYNDLVDGTSRVRSKEPADGGENEVQLEPWASNADSPNDTPHFRDKTRDPVRELFESIERKSAPSNDLPDSAKPERKVCIIFHGAPFTEYQEAACRSARVLNVPVLSIDKAIMEAIALGKSSSSNTLRQIIDNAYENYTEAYESHAKRLAEQTDHKTDEIDSTATRNELKRRKGRHGTTKSSASEKSSKTEDLPRKQRKGEARKSSGTGGTNARNEVILLRLRADPDPLIEFNKVPAAKTLETLDPLTRYEYKVQVVSQLEKILGPRAMASESPTDRVSAKNADKSARRKRDDTTYLGMGSELLTAALLERKGEHSGRS